MEPGEPGEAGGDIPLEPISTVDEVREALELCKSDLTKPNTVFDLQACSKDQKRLVLYGEAALQYLERALHISSVRDAIIPNTSSFFFQVVHIVGKPD